MCVIDWRWKQRKRVLCLIETLPVVRQVFNKLRKFSCSEMKEIFSVCFYKSFHPKKGIKWNDSIDAVAWNKGTWGYWVLFKLLQPYSSWTWVIFVLFCLSTFWLFHFYQLFYLHHSWKFVEKVRLRVDFGAQSLLICFWCKTRVTQVGTRKQEDRLREETALARQKRRSHALRTRNSCSHFASRILRDPTHELLSKDSDWWTQEMFVIYGSEASPGPHGRIFTKHELFKVSHYPWNVCFCTQTKTKCLATDFLPCQSIVTESLSQDIWDRRPRAATATPPRAGAARQIFEASHYLIISTPMRIQAALDIWALFKATQFTARRKPIGLWDCVNRYEFANWFGSSFVAFRQASTSRKVQGRLPAGHEQSYRPASTFVSHTERNSFYFLSVWTMSLLWWCSNISNLCCRLRAQLGCFKLEKFDLSCSWKMAGFGLKAMSFLSMFSTAILHQSYSATQWGRMVQWDFAFDSLEMGQFMAERWNKWIIFSTNLPW